MAAACRVGRSLTPAQRDLLAGGLAEQGDLAAARRCLGTLPPQTARTRERLAARAPEPGPAERAWERTRQLLLQRNWQAAAASLANDRSSNGSPPREARRRFWLGLTAALQGRRQEAQQHWQTLLGSHPYGYYAWRASERLQSAPPAPPAAAAATGLLPPAVARLSRLNLAEEAWEHWRTWRGGTTPSTPADLWREGQLRVAVGDRWIGLAQLDRAALAGAARSPAQQALLEQQRHPLSFQRELQQAAAATGVDQNLLTAIARQESRLTPTVHSVAGAVGLMQLLQETDREVMLAVASYNAGPGAAQGWINPDLKGLPELWAEAIPYPETRHYVKTVLGNRWTYRLLNGSNP
jgi:soluble lytic murein transglycosylase